MTSSDGAGLTPMTPSNGAVAMATALGPRAGAEAEERRRLLRAVTRLQACARGFLLRRRLRGLREEFEAVVLEIEGDLRHLHWTGRVLQRPRFDPELSPGKPLDPGEAAKNETIPKKNPEKPDPPGAKRAGSFGNIPSSAPLPSGTTPKPPKPPNLGCGAAKNLKNEGGALAGSEEWDKDSVASEWDSSHLGEIPADLQGLPRSELQSHRNHLLMELLWIQQAIASRKQFLLLKQKLGIPNHSGIPEFLDWCGEALEQQHKS